MYVYRNNSGEIPVSGFIENTHKKIRSKFEFMLRYIKDENNPLCEPYVKHFTIDIITNMDDDTLREVKSKFSVYQSKGVILNDSFNDNRSD